MLNFPISCFNDSFWEFVRMAVTWPLPSPAALCGALAGELWEAAWKPATLTISLTSFQIYLSSDRHMFLEIFYVVYIKVLIMLFFNLKLFFRWPNPESSQ